MIRTGIGYDAHQLGYDYPLIIGGVKIPSKKIREITSKDR